MNSCKKHTWQKRPNKELEHLRLRKKKCKAARKTLIKAGLKGSLEEESITKTWHSLIHQHNKLRVALLKKESVKDQLKAENRSAGTHISLLQSFSIRRKNVANLLLLRSLLSNILKRPTEMKSGIILMSLSLNLNVLCCQNTFFLFDAQLKVS